MARASREEVEQELEKRAGFRYATSVPNCLLPGVTPELFLSELKAAAGSELHPRGRNKAKFLSVASSSALAVNSFAPWKGWLDDFVVLGRSGFSSLRFEEPFPNGLRGTHPHLDVVLRRSSELVAIESKFLEPLGHSATEISSVYLEIRDHRAGSKWFRVLRDIASRAVSFERLDAVQLVKHFAGLCLKMPTTPTTLLLLYWEPENGEEFEEYQMLHREVSQFRELVEGDELLAFEACSYGTLWGEWEKASTKSNIREHCRNLRARYDLVLRSGQ